MIEQYINTIQNCDAISFMKHLPDKCVDLVLTDPPYGLNYNYDVYQDTEENLVNLVNEMMPQFFRISKRVLLSCGHTNILKYPKFNWILCWYYGTTNARNSWGFTTWQPILCYGKDPYLENGLGARMDSIKDSHSPEKEIKNKLHSCNKPLPFWTKLLLRGSVKETDIIFDPFMGSGTTAIACLKTNRRFIGCEISEKYCEIANKRISDYLAQGTLF